MQTLRAVCNRVFLAGAAKYSCSHLVLRDARTAPEPSCPAAQAAGLPARGAARGDSCMGTISPAQGRPLGWGQGALVMSMPVPWTAFRLMQDLGALSGALGLWGALAGFGAGRGSNQSPVPPTRPPSWSLPTPSASSPIKTYFTSSESRPMHHREGLTSTKSSEQTLILIT